MALFYWLLFRNMVLDQFADGGVLVSICIVAKCVLTITYPSMLLSDVNCFLLFFWHVHQRCEVSKAFQATNGRICTPLSRDLGIPMLLDMHKEQGLPQKSDTKLRVFSGTANLALAQVLTSAILDIYIEWCFQSI